MRLLTNIGLYIFAAVLCVGLAPLALIHTIIDQIRYGSRSRLADSFHQGAYALDVYANVTYPSFLNAWFLKKGGYHFGAEDETISSALGKNWTLGRLSVIAQGCVGLLNLVDRDHCFKYIKGNWNHPKPAPVAAWKTLLFTTLLVIVVGGIVICMCYALN
jgi:hypothetical protein